LATAAALDPTWTQSVLHVIARALRPRSVITYTTLSLLADCLVT
jgi:hypothetical protein